MKYIDLQKTGKKIIEERDSILILVRYPFHAGNKDFFLFKSTAALERFFQQREPKESISIFTQLEKRFEGWVNQNFHSEILARMDQPKYTDWILISTENLSKNNHWYYLEGKRELEEELSSQIGNWVYIIEDPAYLDEKVISHAYVPDLDGKVRPGVY